MAHKPTIFQMMAFAIIDGRELTVVSKMTLKSGQVIASDYRTELAAPAQRFARECQDWLLDLAKEENRPLAGIRVRVGLKYGERAPIGFKAWEKDNSFRFEVEPAVPA